MISLSDDVLLFETSSGEILPFSADMISVQLLGEAAHLIEPDFNNESSLAVFYYFKKSLGRTIVTVAEFTQALEMVLRGLALSAQRAASAEESTAALAGRVIVEADLHKLVAETGATELLFFARLREELRQHLQTSPRLLCFHGLRGCVKYLAGAKRWSGRCQELQYQIVNFMRSCLSVESRPERCSILVE